MSPAHDPFAPGADWSNSDDDKDGIKNIDDATPQHHSEELIKNGFDINGLPLPGNPATHLPDDLPDEGPLKDA